MSTSKRILLLFGATASLALAVALLYSAGLPERAQFTGITTVGEISVAPEINALAPPFTLRAISGEEINLIDLRGAPVVINFWATWCVPCALEMPELQAVYEQYQARGLRILGVNLGESPEAIKAWQESLGLSFDLLLDPPQKIAALYYLRGQPSTYIVSPRGTITHIHYGPVSTSTLLGDLAGYFNE